MNLKKTLFAASAPAALALSIPWVLASDSETKPAANQEGGRYDSPVTFDLTFILHVDENLAEQDVFVEREPGSGSVYRPTKAERNLNLPLYATAEPIEHAPFESEKLGPWTKGEPLGLTLGEWLAGQGRRALPLPGRPGLPGGHLCQSGPRGHLHHVALFHCLAANRSVHRHL